jgi:hypothetical protein
MLHRILAAALMIGASASLSAQSSLSFEIFTDTYNLANVNGIASGDFNNDAKPDIVQCCNSTGLVFRAGDGDGSFAAPVTAASAPDGATYLVAADVNGDGKLDLVGLRTYGNYTGSPTSTGFYVWLGNGDGTFQAPVEYSTSASTVSVATGNFFGDGHPDLAVGETNGTVDLFRNDGNGAFTLANTVSIGSSTAWVQLAAGDLNGTGDSDLAAVVYPGPGGSGPLYVLWNDGKGNFTSQELNTSYVEPSVTVSRLNGDGQMDILVSYVCNPTPTGVEAGHQPPYDPCAGFDAYYGQGNNQLYKRTLVTDENIYNLGIPFGVDVNGDGYGDIVSAGSINGNQTIGLFVWLGNADGSFQQTPQYFISNTDSAGPMAAADFAP